MHPIPYNFQSCNYDDELLLIVWIVHLGKQIMLTKTCCIRYLPRDVRPIIFSAVSDNNINENWRSYSVCIRIWNLWYRNSMTHVHVTDTLNTIHIFHFPNLLFIHSSMSVCFLRSHIVTNCNFLRMRMLYANELFCADHAVYISDWSTRIVNEKSRYIRDRINNVSSKCCILQIRKTNNVRKLRSDGYIK